jgi:hypothetical protein
MLKKSVMAALLFLTASPATDKSLPQMRMTPTEIQASTAEDNQTGGSGPGSREVTGKCSSAIPERRASTRFFCWCPRTPQSKRTPTVIVAWQLWCRASGTSAMEIDSMVQRSRRFRRAASTRNRAA